MDMQQILVTTDGQRNQRDGLADFEVQVFALVKISKCELEDLVINPGRGIVKERPQLFFAARVQLPNLRQTQVSLVRHASCSEWRKPLGFKAGGDWRERSLFGFAV